MNLRYSIDPADTDGGMTADAIEQEITAARAEAETEALVEDIIRWDDTMATDGPCDGTWDSLAKHLTGRGWTRLAAQEPTHTIEAVTITALASRHYVDDNETGVSHLHPVYGNRSSIEIMLPEGTSLPRLTLGGEWTITLTPARAAGRADA